MYRSRQLQCGTCTFTCNSYATWSYIYRDTATTLYLRYNNYPAVWHLLLQVDLGPFTVKEHELLLVSLGRCHFRSFGQICETVMLTEILLPYNPRSMMLVTCLREWHPMVQANVRRTLVIVPAS
jgi:hypothetical protein